MKNGEGGLSIFLGLEGTKEDLGLAADNYWIFTENNLDELYVLGFETVNICCAPSCFPFSYQTQLLLQV